MTSANLLSTLSVISQFLDIFVLFICLAGCLDMYSRTYAQIEIDTSGLKTNY